MNIVFAILSIGMVHAHPGPSHAPPEATPSAVPVDPISNTSREQVCKSDALLLIKHPIADLENSGWTQFCCGENPVFEGGRCEIDWPSSDVPVCDIWDDMRNQIYARYGYPFKSEKWQAWASKQAWYERRADFEEGWLSTVATKNVATLKQYAATEHHCQGKGK